MSTLNGYASASFATTDAPWSDREASAFSLNSIGFGLLLLLTGVIFIRPAELLPDLEGWPLYEVTIILTMIVSLPAMLMTLSPASLQARPAVLCAIGVMVAIFLSHATKGDLWSARMLAGDFGKVLLYFLLLISLVDSGARLRAFLVAMVLFVLVIASLSLLQFHGSIDLPALSPIVDRLSTDPETGETVYILRLQACGIFGDPNDFAMVLAAASLLAVYAIVEPGSFARRAAILAVLGVLLWAFFLTRSRGGLLSLAGGAVTLFVCRFGWKRGLPLALVICGPLIAVGGGGRQLNIDLGNKQDTAQGRIYLWREGMALFKTFPIFGVGQGMMVEEATQVAHNSFVQAFAEWGALGGTAFVGVMGLPLLSLYRVTRNHRAAVPSGEDEPDATSGWPKSEGERKLESLSPYVLAMYVAYMVGLVSLSRCTQVPTYLVAALAVAYVTLRADSNPQASPPLSLRLIGQLCMAALACIIFFDVFVRVFVL